MSLRPANIKGQYSDTLARQRRVHFVLKLIFILSIVALAGAGLVYASFFAGLMDLRTISISGLKTLNSDELRDQIDNMVNDKIFGFIPSKNNLLFLDADNIKMNLLSKFPILKSIELITEMPHEIILDFQEREMAGTWCFVGADCRAFDLAGATWPSAVKSTGYLMASVDDLRKLEIKEIDKEYFEAMKIFFKGSGVLPFISGEIIIPEKSFRDFSVYSADGYPILFSLDTDIIGQLKILGIFLSDKQKEAGFVPKYIDLRIDGRVYYK